MIMENTGPQKPAKYSYLRGWKQMIDFFFLFKQSLRAIMTIIRVIAK